MQALYTVAILCSCWILGRAATIPLSSITVASLAPSSSSSLSSSTRILPSGTDQQLAAVIKPSSSRTSSWLPSSSGLPPSAGTLAGNFSQVLCSQDVIGDPMADPALRWSEADCNDAWTAVVRYWNEDPASQGLGFVPAVSHYFNAPEGWDCGKMGSDPCGAGPGSCGDKNERGDVNNPAGWMILQSFTTLHNFQYNQFQALGVAEAAVQGQMGAFASTFAPIEDKESAIKILLDILGLGLSLISAGVWNKVLKDASIFTKPNDPNNHGWAKDSANAIISQSITLSKDTLSSAQSELEAQNDLASYVSQLVNSWEGVIAKYTENLFSGSTASPGLSDLHNLMQNGVGLNNGPTGLDSAGIYDMQAIMENTIFGLLIPKAWQTSNEDVHPVILLPNNNATGCTGNPWSDWVSDDIAASSGVCYNNQAYYLFNVAGGPCNDLKERETGPGILPCPNKVLSELPGVGTLDGTAWGGVTRDDLAISALQAYTLNNNANGYQMPELTNVINEQGQIGDIYFENGIRTPGLTSIPICDIETVASNWQNHGRSGSKPVGYPCS